VHKSLAKTKGNLHFANVRLRTGTPGQVKVSKT